MGASTLSSKVQSILAVIVDMTLVEAEIAESGTLSAVGVESMPLAS